MKTALSWISQALIVLGTIALAQIGALPALIIFVISNITFVAYGVMTKQPSFIYLQTALGLINAYGIWRLVA